MSETDKKKSAKSTSSKLSLSHGSSTRTSPAKISGSADQGDVGGPVGFLDLIDEEEFGAREPVVKVGIKSNSRDSIGSSGGELKEKDKEKRSKKFLLSEVEEFQRELEDQHRLIESFRTQVLLQSKEIDRLRNLFMSSVGTDATQDATKSIQASSAFYAASKGKIAWLTHLLERGADIHQTNPDGRTALHISVCEDQCETVEFLIKSGAPLLTKDRWGRTPLDEAIRMNNYRLAKLLEMAITTHEFKSLEKEYKLGAYIAPGAEELVHPVPLQRKISKLISTVKPSAPLKPKAAKLLDLPAGSMPPLSTSMQMKPQPPTSPKEFDLHHAKSTSDITVDDKKHGGHKKKSTATTSPGPAQHKAAKRPLRHFFNFMKGNQTTPTPSKDSSATPTSSEATNAGAKPAPPAFGLAFGILRGACKVPDCDCRVYKKGENGNVCTCSHFPASHENLGEADILQGLENLKFVDEAVITTLVPSDQSAGSDSWPKVLNQDLELDSDSAALKELLGGEGRSWIISPDQLVFIRQIGQGTSALVYEGVYNEKRVAIKLIQFKPGDKRPRDKQHQQIVEEFNVMSAVDSPHVVRFLGLALEPRTCIVLEYMSHGSLYDILTNEEEDSSLELTWPLMIRWFNDTLEGVQALHNWKPQIVHRDLKSLNLLIDDNLKLKVADFGLSRFLEDSSNQTTLGKLRGTYAYSAPEVYFGEFYSSKSDVYSLSIVLWEMVMRLITGKYQRPFSEYPFITFDFQIIIQSAKKDTRPTIPGTVPVCIAELIRLLWSPKPDARPDVATIIKMMKQITTFYSENKEEWDDLLPMSKAHQQPLSASADDSLLRQLGGSSFSIGSAQENPTNSEVASPTTAPALGSMSPVLANSARRASSASHSKKDKHRDKPRDKSADAEPKDKDKK